ncbi:D-serine deaminase-like pyridoxal phosphate-dependent protein [Paenibacillus phyllosphaerae]|uniref:D-serine deaminase-like pyridoxal phosphate-dependent protein n=1 Tax=Paenibacillus phyllosphaerae TaxID=274593 RepID=A0A7W5AZM8_9BACL|nr:alanine racemase [Paenibacillus phyllosphaerae]MBB3111211.1 D-serine deaminase-like pyridoxal phosphate-dependent protein [Paenibacillus phyllosphaerae]
MNREASAASKHAWHPDLARIETPAVVIDTTVMTSNIRAMAQVASRSGVALRPHAKTHKMPDIAKQQLEAGAAGITVAKVSEAEVMADGGIDDMFIAYPLIAPSKIERAIAVGRRMKRLIVGVDSLTGARLLSASAVQHGFELEVRLEIDSGMKRTGILPAEAIMLAREIAQLDGLRLTGIYTFRGALLDGKPTLDIEAAGLQEGSLMVSLAEDLREAGIPIQDVSVGSSPTGAYAATVPGVTEIRPGTYVYQDRMTAGYGICTLDDCAAYVVATVVSSRPDEGHAVIDGGSKTFATDVQPGTFPLQLQGFGHALEAPDAVLERLSEEHGILRLSSSIVKPGDRLRIIPNHICSTINLHNSVYLLGENGISRKIIPARGMLE